ncbi:hypothetical protein AAG906_009391 [Vitis piasezkii]
MPPPHLLLLVRLAGAYFDLSQAWLLHRIGGGAKRNEHPHRAQFLFENSVALSDEITGRITQIMECTLKFQKFCLVETRRWIFMVGLVAITYLLCQSLLLPYGNALLSLLPDRDVPIYDNFSSPTRQSSVKSFMVNKSLLSNASDLTDTSLFVEVVEDVEKSNVTVEFGDDNGTEGTDEDIEDGLALEREDLENIVEFNEDDNGPKEKGGDTENFASESKGMDHVVEFTKDNNISKGLPFKKVVDMDGISALEYVSNQENSSDLKKDSEMRHIGFAVHIVKPPNEGISTDNIVKADASLTPSTPGSLGTTFKSHLLASPGVDSLFNTTYVEKMASNGNASNHLTATDISSVGKPEKEILSKDENLLVLQSDLADLNNNSAMTSNPGRKKMRSEMPPKSVTSIYDMNRRLVRHRASSRAMRPRWASPRDQEMLAAKLQIQNAPRVKNDPELHAPLFRNVSMFKRSYELMERILKVYVYKDGEKPIFHQPILKGLYASEGWFMKLMERNKRFVVKDPRQAQLFYMPFSSRMLEYKLYVRNSHNRTNLRQYLKQYSEKIAAKYRFWNRTGGSDHFLVACHDWAPYETRHHMEQCIKALCNADVTAGFKIGRDVSLPETYVRSARNPLRDLGGKPPSERHILAFYAGNMHGYLRPILLKYWKDKDPDMKIYGPMPPGVASKMNYIQHMKSSKFCICPKGYEVNSPRVVEAIFYECVPVIISDNFVPPFFDVLDWGAFSIILAEKDIPNLKDVLLSIPNEKYLQMQLGVRKVQKHFLWHAKPLKYDLFHMTLHSIWYNRVFQSVALTEKVGIRSSLPPLAYSLNAHRGADACPPKAPIASILLNNVTIFSAQNMASESGVHSYGVGEIGDVFDILSWVLLLLSNFDLVPLSHKLVFLVECGDASGYTYIICLVGIIVPTFMEVHAYAKVGVGHISSNSYLFERRRYQRKDASCPAMRITGLQAEHPGFYLSMDDIFAHFLTLTSYIRHRFIRFIENLVTRDVNRYSEDPVMISFCERRAFDLKEESHVNIRSQIAGSNYSYQSTSLLFQGSGCMSTCGEAHRPIGHELGLLLPFFGMRLAWRLAWASSRYSFCFVRCMQIRTTLHGSSDDIGWLQCTPGVAPVEDGTARFLELLREIRNGKHTLPNSYVYLLIPGLFSNHGPLYFVNTKKFFSKMGLACHIAKIHSEASVEHNAWELKQYIEELYWGSGKCVILLGHSKGGDKVAGLALVQSPYGGTPLASDILREGQIADREIRRIMEFLICKLIKGDIQALEDLTYEKRREFIMNHKLPECIPLISFHSEASVAPSVLATMSHVAHAELPLLPLPRFGSKESDVQEGCKVPVVIPISAVLSLCALHLQLRYGEKSDGLVTCRDAEVPGSVVVKPDLKLDHAWMVYSSGKKDLSEPDACEMSEALLTLLVELGKTKKEQRRE